MELPRFWFLLDAIYARACSRYYMTFPVLGSGKNVLQMRCSVLTPSIKSENIAGHVLNFENKITSIACYEIDVLSKTSLIHLHVFLSGFKNDLRGSHDLVPAFKIELPARHDLVILTEYFLDAGFK
ncbi:MAG: hypothetical protein QNK37_30805 [Acidobacteriota bacterium]|nr:hypothetical protein [Acidobacteriota bacterium]